MSNGDGPRIRIRIPRVDYYFFQAIQTAMFLAEAFPMSKGQWAVKGNENYTVVGANAFELLIAINEITYRFSEVGIK